MILELQHLEQVLRPVQLTDKQLRPSLDAVVGEVVVHCSSTSTSTSRAFSDLYHLNSVSPEL